MLWMLLTVMAAVAAVGLTLPLVRRRNVRCGRGGGVVAVLKAQFAEIDAQMAAGTLMPEEVEVRRTEIERRILTEGAGAEAPARPLGERPAMLLGVGLAAVVAVAATALYLTVGRPDLAGVTAVSAPATGFDRQGTQLAALVPQLEARMRATPGEPRGWRMLGWAYMQLGRPADAAGAYGRASALDPASAEYRSAQGEALTSAAGGQVTPGALAVFKTALARDEADPRARYFVALARDQGGDHGGAMADWIALLKSAPAGAPWTADVRAFVVRVAQERGEDIAGRLPPADQAAPDQQAPDQQKMIAGMVDRLAARLKDQPHNAEGWVRLMRARLVLGNPAAAAGAYHAALAAFRDSPTDQTALRTSAREMGVPGA